MRIGTKIGSMGIQRNRNPEAISRNMASILRSGSQLEKWMQKAMRASGLRPTTQPKQIFGNPDFAFVRKRIAIFCDSHFWHGYDWDTRKQDHKSNRNFWIPKIERNIERDKEVTRALKKSGWLVLRFWQHEIMNSPSDCVLRIQAALKRRTN
jgi:DNA mismatch endonuclease (patch repair protein)